MVVMSADMRLLGLAPSSPDGYYTPMSRRLFDAIKDSSLIQVKLLVFHSQLDINTKNHKGENSLIEALRIDDSRKRRVTVSFLMRSGINVHNRDITDRDALEWSAKLNREKQALLLLNGPMLEYDYLHKDCDGLTLLHYAVINNMQRLVEAIIQRLTRYYISIDIPDSEGLTPYIHAKRLNLTHVADRLAEAGASTGIQPPTNSDTPNTTRRANTPDEIIKLKINGRLPELKRFLAPKEQNRFQKRASPIGAQHEITSLLQLKREGHTCERFVNSTSVAEMSESAMTTGTGGQTRFSNMSPSEYKMDLGDIFTIVSDQMTQSFCRPAQLPKPKHIVFNRVKPKRSTLAAIMKKPAPNDRRKSNMRRASKKDMSSAKHQTVPTITTSCVE